MSSEKRGQNTTQLIFSEGLFDRRLPKKKIILYIKKRSHLIEKNKNSPKRGIQALNTLTF